jgi:hypothetical protein
MRSILNKEMAVPESHFVVIFTAPSLRDSKQRDVKLVENLSGMRGSSCDEDSRISKKTSHLLTGMMSAMIHQQEGIFISKLIET